MILHEYEDEFRDLVTIVSQYYGIREVFIEKDYWVTNVLKNLSNSIYQEQIVFKGGTSLSKVFKVIKRFSEDVDLAYDENMGGVKPHYSKHFSKIDKEITKTLNGEVQVEGQTQKGPPSFRKTIHQYKRIITSNDFGDATDKLILEINAFTKPFPHERKKVSSYIYDYLIATGQNGVVEEFELGDFEVNVLNYKKTFAEKICGMAKFSNKENDNLDIFRNKIRHLYDVSKLLEELEIKTFLDSDDFFKVLHDVREDDRKMSNNATWSTKKFNEALIFKTPKETIVKVYGSFSQGQFPSLLYTNETLPTVEKLIEQFEKIADRLIEYDSKFEMV